MAVVEREIKTDDKITVKGVLVEIDAHGLLVKDVKSEEERFISFEKLFDSFEGDEINLTIKKTHKQDLDVETE